MDFISSLFYFIIVIGVLVLIHEFGHFIAARISGMRTDVFSIGMGTRLFGWNRITGFTFGPMPRKKNEDGTDSEDEIDLNGHCDYRIAVFPIGGYVKIAGMVDESMDTDYVETEPQPWEFRSKNTFQKAFVISAGVIMNIILAYFIFSGIIFFKGESVASTTTVAYVQPKSIAAKAGILPGDKILSVNGNQVSDWNTLSEKMRLDDFGKDKLIKYERNGEKFETKADGEEIVKSMVNAQGNDYSIFGMTPDKLLTILTAVDKIQPAGKAGMKAGDTILSVDGEAINSFKEFQDILQANKSKPFVMSWKRDSKILSDTITTNSKGMIGVALNDLYTGKKATKEFGLGQSLTMGFSQTYRAMDLFVSSIAQIFKGNISVKKSLGGPIAIAVASSDQAKKGIVNFLNFMALLSISLALINIFPFPALDGGHLVFIIIEAVIRREVSVNVKMRIQQFGIIILLALMAFIVYNDISRYI